MRYILLFIVAMTVLTHISAQFARVQPNVENIATRSLTKSAGENDLVSVIDGELFHITLDTAYSVNIEWIENSIVNIYDFVMHDIDRDGDKDIICYERLTSGFNVYLKDEGKFHYYPEWNIGSGGAHYLHSQDFNDDGFEDLMINHNIYANTGVNERERVLRYPLLNTYYYENVHFLDYDHDGDKDILFHQVHRLWVLLNKGKETITASFNIPESNNVTEWSRVIRTTDGEKVIYYDRGVNKIKEVIFTDSASYEIKELVDVIIDPNGSEVIVADLDKDGTEEIIINSYNYRDIVVFQYDVQNNSGRAVTLQLNTDPVLSFGLFEIENEPILFLAKEDANHTYSFNDTLLPVLRSSMQSAITGYDNGFSDIDGNGNVEIISKNVIMPYLGSGEFGEIFDISFPSTGGSLIDYDMDGDLDYVKMYEWYENIGDYMFGPLIEIPDDDPTPDPEIFFTKELIRRDIDLDGDIDILTYNNFGEPLELLENDNDLEFKDPVTIATSADISGDVVYIDILDMDGDNINDILFATHSGMVILKGAGGVIFNAAEPLYAGNNKPLTVNVEDINLDGFPDVLLSTRNIIAGSSLGEAILYVGNDNFPTARTLSVASGYHRSAFANIDGSGMVDIVLLNTAGLSWIKLNSDYSFVKTQIDAGFLQNGVFIVSDVDSDDDDDIILYRDNTIDIYFYLNGEVIGQGDGCPNGDVYIHNQAQLDRYRESYGLCEVINGDLTVGRTDDEWSEVDDISVFSNVKHINGNLKLISNYELPDLTGLDSLEKIEGTFNLINHKSEDLTGVEKLRFVGGDFILSGVGTVSSNAIDLAEFESLDTILGDVHILRSYVSSINSILQPVFYGDLKMEYAYKFNDLDSFAIVDSVIGDLVFLETKISSLEALSDIAYIGGMSVQSNQELYTFGAARAIEHIEGDVFISNNRYLNMSDGLNQLKTVGGDMRVQAPHCGVFENLQYINGELNLLVNSMGESSFELLDSIGLGLSILTYQGDDFHQLSNLKKINGFLNITNNEVTSLYGLHNFKNEITDYYIANNDLLRDLDALNDSLTVNGQWVVSGNDALNYCNSVPLCRHIASGRPVSIKNNGIDCQDVSSLRCTDNIISGFVYHDFNKNGLMDANEAVLSNTRIVFSTSQDTFITSGNGYFLTSALPGDSVNIQVVIPDNWYSTGDSSIEIDSFIVGAADNYGNNFGLHPEFEKSEMSFTYNQGLFLCNREFDLDVGVFNTGTKLEHAFVRIHYPEYVELDTGYSDFTEHDEINNILYYTLDPIYPFFSSAFTVPFVAPAASHLEEIFATRIELFRQGDFDLELIAELTYDSRLLCSFDPNDKLVRSSNGSMDIHLDSEDTLIYTIRFQNTGNYFAENVRIVDTLSDYLDYSSFEFIASSHPVEIKQRDSIFYFNFYDIHLPDSLMDFAGSQGFVTFRIKPVSTSLAGLEINNEAQIYFDYNDAILTNLVTSAVVEITSLNDPADDVSFVLHPNPAQHEVYVLLEDEVGTTELDYVIYNTVGNLVARGELTGSTVDLSGLNSGLYFIGIFGRRVDYGMQKIIVIAQ